MKRPAPKRPRPDGRVQKPKAGPALKQRNVAVVQARARKHESDPSLFDNDSGIPPEHK